MCGIAGILRFDAGQPDLQALQAMCTVMRSRGPDGAGIAAWGGTALGHRRLKIIDLSERSRQPLIDAGLGLSLVFNGCIYNFRELREELQQAGYRFFSDGDGEVILKAWHAWGPASVERLNGMFAFAIQERDGGRIHLVRDRLGIKPFYLAERDGGGELRFASSLPALLAGGGISTAIDPVAFHHYLHFHAVVPPPRTILAGIRKLPPATIRSIEPDGSASEHCYWRPDFHADPAVAGRSDEEWRDRVLTALRLAVQRRLVADVPVGVLLSGGLDSSLIVGLLAEAGQQLSTFSIGFESVGTMSGDEFAYSDIIAERYGTDHHRIRVDSQTFLPQLDDCIRAMNEPMVSHDCIGFYLLSKEVAKHVTVVQSGQGADEIFAGYSWYPPMASSSDPAGDYARVFCDRDPDEYAATVADDFVGPDHSRAFIEAVFAGAPAESGVDQALYMDTTVMLVDDPVKRVDNMTMAWSLEARVPFLDHELVELAARVPARLKLAQEGKGILKEAARQVIPAAVIDRSKGYFPVPALKYLRGPYLDWVRETVSDATARRRGLFRPDYVERLLADPEGHITPLQGSKLWQVALLERWLRDQGIGA